MYVYTREDYVGPDTDYRFEKLCGYVASVTEGIVKCKSIHLDGEPPNAGIGRRMNGYDIWIDERFVAGLSLPSLQAICMHEVGHIVTTGGYPHTSREAHNREYEADLFSMFVVGGQTVVDAMYSFLELIPGVGGTMDTYSHPATEKRIRFISTVMGRQFHDATNVMPIERINHIELLARPYAERAKMLQG